ncbi:aminopeptidase N [Aquirhabdus sp.]|uniref:aminopeptidase N n=1 Tax=Aquirhabdus sp. TaxID=2824160 RepID=UPI00396CFC1C
MNIAVNPDDHAVHPTIYLKDYQPPVFGVSTIDLDIRIHDTETLVVSTLEMQRLHAGELVLLGRDLELLNVQLNGSDLAPNSYRLDKETLTILNAPDQCTIKTEVRIHPENNTQLEGLYKSGGMYCTQNEPEGFRKITFFPDRPDVLAVYTTRLEADNQYPTLLANGNLIEAGQVGADRHYTIWQDPTKKPSYLFACVAGDLAVLKDSFTTMEGKPVALEIYTEEKDIEKCHVAMQALKDSMLWDEEHYGRAYDLDNYMIVAVSQFNMGAMENKGLNIFNTSCVLSSPETSTDASNFYVKSTIAHEYFHNWTGNRITCRDWFQLCLKEGFTVFRDQSFSDTLQSPAVQRIDDVSSLKSAQFAEDAGPLSHPPRPDHFVEINNFYTATVYDKGAEIVRMMATLLGEENFRLGTDEYFRRHDGEAVTVEDLIGSLSDGSGTDLWNFLPWYSQPGTPVVTGQGVYDAETRRYTLTLSQSIPKKPNYPAPQPLPIPVKIALFNQQTGQPLLLDAQGETETVLMLNQSKQVFVFEHIASQPIVSLLRDFSAPVLLNFDYQDQELAFLMQYETNGFNQWQAAQQLLERILLQGHDASAYLEALLVTLPKVASVDPLLASRLLDIPTETFIASRIDSNYDPVAVRSIREALMNAIAAELKDFWSASYAALPIVPYADTSEAMGQRALRNAVLAFASRAGIANALTLASQQYDVAVCMTERLGALRQLVNYDAVDHDAKLTDFYQRFENEALAIDLWFGLQASKPNATIDEITRLSQHPQFDLNTPNRVRSITGNFATNPVAVWTTEGAQFYANLAKTLDAKNPILGSRILQVLSRWYTLKEPLRTQVRAVIDGLQGQVTSSSVVETLANLQKAG